MQMKPDHEQERVPNRACGKVSYHIPNPTEYVYAL